MTGQIERPGLHSPVGPARRKSAFSYGMVPVATAGGLTLLCAGLLGFGGLASINNAPGGNVGAPPGTSTSASPSALASPGITASPSDPSVTTTDGGTSTTSPTNPPERESAPEKVSPTDTVYTIVWGDTLTRISLDTGRSIERLAEYNGIPNVDLIYANATLTIPYLLIPAD